MGDRSWGGRQYLGIRQVGQEVARKMGTRLGGEMKCLGIGVSVRWEQERDVGDGGLACLWTGLVGQIWHC